MTMLVRPAEAQDQAAVRRVLTASFPSHAEADLVERLAADGDLATSFVAVEDGVVIGYAGFSRMKVVADGHPIRSLALAPVAVLAEHRRRGVARRMIERGLAAANGGGTALVFVLGDPGIYGRLGFRAAEAAPFASPYSGPDFQAQWLSSRRPVTSGQAGHAAAFSSLS